MAKAAVEEPGEQLDLIEITPENAKVIQKIAKAYKKIVRERLAIQQKEKDLKDKLLDAVHEAEIVPDADGKYTFSCGNDVIITVTPRDELVQVKTPDNDDE